MPFAEDPHRADGVCHRCFRDKVLREFITSHGVRGPCPWCGRNGVMVPLSALSQAFRDVAELYVPVEGPSAYREGEYLSFLLDDGWHVFDEKIQVNDLAQELTISIIYADLRPKERSIIADYEGFFRYSDNELEQIWDDKSYIILENEESGSKRENIGDLGNGISDAFPDQLRLAFEDLTTVFSVNTLLYRARIHQDRARSDRFRLDELGAPPPDLARPGRANRKGEPVLYLATNKSTALAEVRAWKGAAVAIADVRLRRDVCVVDLRRRRRLQSPFFVELLKWRVELDVLLHRLAEDLSRPVMPHEEIILYKPTQLLGELIKDSQYDGFVFPSAMGSGGNVVLFNPADADVVQVRYVRVSRASFFSEEMDHNELPYEEGPYDYALVPR